MNGLKRMLPEIFEYISTFKCIKHKEKEMYHFQVLQTEGLISLMWLLIILSVRTVMLVSSVPDNTMS